MLLDSGATHLARPAHEGERLDEELVEVELAGGVTVQLKITDATTLIWPTGKQTIMPLLEFCCLTGTTQMINASGVMTLSNDAFGEITAVRRNGLPVVDDPVVQKKMIDMYEQAKIKELADYGKVVLQKLANAQASEEVLFFFACVE